MLIVLCCILAKSFEILLSELSISRLLSSDVCKRPSSSLTSLQTQLED